MLEPFVEHGLSAMPDAQLPALERILEMQDQDMLAGLLGNDALMRAQAGEAGVEVARVIRRCLHGAEGRV